MGVFTRRQVPALAPAPSVRPLTGGAGARAPLPYRTVRTLTASARVLNLKSREELEKISRGRAGNEWQAEAWEYFDAVGEVKYALTMVSNIVSRLRLYAGQVDEASQAPTPANPDEPGGAAAIAALARLDSAFGGQPGLLRDAALNLCVSGECYLVQRRAVPALSQPESWDIRSTDELTVSTAGKITLQTQRVGSGTGFRKELPDSTYIARIWRPHPRWSDDPESSMRGVLELCQELLLLSRTFRATARSRLNAGLLYLPDGLSVAAVPDTEQTGDDEEGMVVPLMPPAADEQDTDEFEDQLLDAMTTPIADEESAAAVVPLLVRGPAELGEKIKLIKFERSFDAALVARADRVLDRIMQAIDVPKDVVTGLANVKYCAHDKTEVLSQRGWLRHNELTTSDQVLTLNHDTGLSEWQPCLAVNTFDVVDEPLHVERNSTHVSHTTSEHRWPTIRKHRSYGQRRTWVTSATLVSGDRFITSAPASDIPREQKYDDDFVELVAWFYTEGCYSPRTNRDWSGFGQSIKANPEKVERIRASLNRLLGPPVATMSRSEAAAHVSSGDPTWREGVSADGSFVNFFFNHELTQRLLSVFKDPKNKVLDESFVQQLTRSQLELFVTVSIMADGHGDDSLGMVWQKLPERLDALEVACAILGITTRRIQDGKFLRITRRRPLVRPRKDKRSTELYTGVVWCPTTENGTWFARDEWTTYFTGNSNAVAIDDSLFKANCEPLALVLCDALTQVFLHPTMKAAGIADDELKKYVVWYDPSEVTTRPNRGDDADSGYEKHAVSASSWRRAHGFSDGDAPDPTEVALRMLVEKGTMTPELSEALLSVIAPDVMANVRQASQASSPAPLPDDVAQALGVGGQPPATNGQAPPPAEPASPPPNPPASTPASSDGLPDVIPEGRLL